jgi:hypothetical protein
MAWDWVGTVVTGVVALAGIYSTSRAGRRQSDTTLQLAREERTQRRLENAYTQLQRTVDLFSVWAEATLPMIHGADYDPFPAPPDDVTSKDASALQVYWSKSVRALVADWTAARNELAILSGLARSDNAAGQRVSDAYARAPELKTKLRAAEDKLLTEMSTELRDLPS